jgi:hypothetical protein
MSTVRAMVMLSDREEISRGLAEGLVFPEIAARIGRDPSVISRDVARHGGRAGYRAVTADQAACAGRERPTVFAVRRSPRLRAVVYRVLLTESVMSGSPLASDRRPRRRWVPGQAVLLPDAWLPDARSEITLWSEIPARPIRLRSLERGRLENEFNTRINKIRWVIEQVIANFKTWRILQTDYRRPIATFATTISTVVALHFYVTA